MNALEIRDLTKHYTGFSLNHLNLTLPWGCIMGLVGENGAGKSTTIKLILNTISRDGGTVTILGRDNRENLCLSKEEIGVVLDEVGLPEYMNAQQIGRMMAGIFTHWQPEAYAGYLRRLALPEDKPFRDFSRGMKMKQGLAVALSHQPKLLLLDEPFAAIDAKVRKELRAWLRELINQVGITSIFVTHDQDEAVEVADEIIITNHGTIEQMGTPLEIYKSPDTPFVAQFIGHTTVVENYDRLKGFDRIENADKAVIRPEFIKISKSGNLDRYQSAAEEGIVTDVVFRGNRMDITVSINGIEVVGERSLEKDLIAVGEKVHVLIYRLYIFDEEKTYLMENSEMQEQDVFYI